MSEGILDDFPFVTELLAGPEGRTLLAAMEALLLARQRERGVNSPESRDAAQRAALAAGQTVNKALGLTALRRRRLLSELTNGNDNVDFDITVGRMVHDRSPTGRSRLCHAMARVLIDYSDTFGGILSDHLAGSLMQMAEGKQSMLAVTRQGNDPATGAALLLRRGVAEAAGYEAGIRFRYNPIAESFWREAANVHNELAQMLRRDGEPCPAVAASTLKDRCLRKGSEERALFDNGRREGAVAAGFGAIDAKLRLDAVGEKFRR